MLNKYDFSNISRWNGLSEKTKKDIVDSFIDNKDPISYIATCNFTPLELVQKFQSLSDPKLIGPLLKPSDWSTYHSVRTNSPSRHVDPYLLNGCCSSHIVAASNMTLNSIGLPLSLSHIKSEPIFSSNNDKFPLFHKYITYYKHKLGLQLTILPTSNKYSPFFKQNPLNKNKITIFDQVGEGSGATKINQHEQILLLNDIYLSIYFDKYLKKNKDSLSSYINKFGQKNFSLLTNASQDLANLLMARATYFGNAIIQYKIDEALKLQLSNSFSLLVGQGKEATKVVFVLAKEITEILFNELGFSIEHVKKNMEAMGFKYSDEPTDFLSALYTGNNFERKFGVVQKLEQEAKVEKNIVNPVDAVLAQASLLAGGITRLRHIIPSYIDEYVVSTAQRKKSLKLQHLEKNMCEDTSRSIKKHLKKGINNYVLAQAVYSGYFELKQNLTNLVLEDYKENRLQEEKPKSAKKRLQDALYSVYATEEEKNQNIKVQSGKLLRRGVKKLIEEKKSELHIGQAKDEPLKNKPLKNAPIKNEEQ